MFLHQNHGAGGGNGSIMVGMFVCLCSASRKPSERVPARIDLGVTWSLDGFEHTRHNIGK